MRGMSVHGRAPAVAAAAGLVRPAGARDAGLACRRGAARARSARPAAAPGAPAPLELGPLRGQRLPKALRLLPQRRDDALVVGLGGGMGRGRGHRKRRARARTHGQHTPPHERARVALATSSTRNRGQRRAGASANPLVAAPAGPRARRRKGGPRPPPLFFESTRLPPLELVHAVELRLQRLGPRVQLLRLALGRGPQCRLAGRRVALQPRRALVAVAAGVVQVGLRGGCSCLSDLSIYV
jgi:hypothetical protein